MIKIRIIKWLIPQIGLMLMFGFNVNATLTSLQVTTHKGKVEGLYDKTLGVYQFKGVPYAKPPIGELRWRPPAAMDAWQGVMPTKDFAARPMQIPIFGDMNFRSADVSEDSLYLNIWSADLTPKRPQPVLVYFHGGGFIAGDGSEPRYDGSSMAQNGVVTVTVNYRLGIFGFMAHSELSAESSYNGSGNYGFLDQVAALRWVKENIAGFGGDPQRITIAGESAGSMSVSALMISPLSKDLIFAVIGESGSIVGSDFSSQTLALAEQKGADILTKLKVKSIADFRELSASDLLQKTTEQDLIWYRPNIDNYFLPQEPLSLLQQGHIAKVPVLAGVNSEEAGFNQVLGDKTPNVENYTNAVKQLYPKYFKQVLALYPGNDKESVLDSAQALASDRFLSYGTWVWAEYVQRHSDQSVYYYLYTHPRPQLTSNFSDMQPALAGGLVEKSKVSETLPSSRGAVHSAEIEYVMGNLATNQVFAWNDDDYAISSMFQGYFIRFIKTGDPNSSELPVWPKFADNKRLVIGTTISDESMSLLRKRYTLMAKINGFELQED
ncbi:carboxylesterase/lipase family protein [Paraglaciecola arctica]|uniref:carboxylesterase/lipase family protein n=1 Tax=Paraglaciecola arctica TaxID=1128911 RepID=UPI001C06D434|nr:carboxylesterase family protein [Paraglaciecola arctica]MBU3001843.1 carboxylesterase family protein [Paraglaciecola arctica]